MTSDNSYVQIQVENEITTGKTPDKNTLKKFSEIVCSPNMQHVAVLDEDCNITFWFIDIKNKSPKNVKIINIDNICAKAKGDRLFAISDNMLTSIGLKRVNPYNFKIFDYKTEEEVLLTFPDWQTEIDFLSFTDNGNIIMVNTRYYRAYVFSNKKKEWICKTMIELKYFKKIYITPKGKLIIFNDTIYEITIWDIKNLSIKTRILVEWHYIFESIEISDDEELLIVSAKHEKIKKTRLYVFSTETGINLAFFDALLFVIDRFHLIASKKGERLLYVLDDPPDKYYNIVDPYNLTNPKDMSDFFENNQIQEPYVIQSDKIVYMTDGNLSIKDLVPDNSDDWMEYLRKELKDTNSITTLSEKRTKIIKNILNNNYNKYISDNEEFSGHYLKWGLELDRNSVILTVTDFNYRKKNWNPNHKKNRLEILPSFHQDGKKFIAHCEILDNDDFIMITRIGVIIWTFRLSIATKTKSIKMHYYWNDCNGDLEKFVSDHNGRLKEFDFSDLKSKDLTSERILPNSSYETICRNLDIEFGEKQTLFREFLKDNIFDEFYLICYGKILMATFISLNDDKWIRTLGNNCIEKCMQENYHLIFKISLLSIIFDFDNFIELSENHPAFIFSTLSIISFVVPSIDINPKLISHLSSYGRYCHLSKTSFINRFTSNICSHRLISSNKNLVIKPDKDYDLIDDKSSITVLAFPLPNFISYPKDYSFWKELVQPAHNCFTYTNRLKMINEEFYSYLNGEALLGFKWNTYGKKYYLTIWAIYTAFLCSFIIAATYFKNFSQTSLYILLNITICLGIWHLIFELRQFIYSPKRYISGFWNFFDLCAFLLPTISSIIWLQRNVIPTSMATISILLLEIKFLLFFRAIEFSGVYFAMILKVAQKSFSFLVILGLVIFAFAHSLHILLRYSTDPWNSTTTYNAIEPDGTIDENSSLIEPSTTSTNMFMSIGSSISAVFIMLTGDRTPISYWELNDNPTLLILSIVFSFIATIYLMNLFIGLLTEAIFETTRESFLILKAEHVIDTQKENWKGYKKPQLSEGLDKVLLLPKKQPDLEQIESEIKELKESHNQAIKTINIIKELKESHDQAIKTINIIANKLAINNI
ncbi:2650_t:CDS:2 [Scutellospora calospora]|uniref:2650_t:CDS:1 n=1 Tax=Scutellospora calospora TaxID=85575 RepID=A0ACA9L1S3_9GLOM|nr:2650_t:CDS:2 [Scutellospora calospora]